MRLIFFILIILLFGMIGYETKRKYIEQKDFLNYLKSFIDYLYLNISIYKNNIDEIINNYLIQQKNKNAKYIKFFTKNNNLNNFNKEIIEKYIYNVEIKFLLNSYFENLGKADIENECNKSKCILKNIDDYLIKTSDEIKTKGELYFKIWLAVGVTIVIILW